MIYQYNYFRSIHDFLQQLSDLIFNILSIFLLFTICQKDKRKQIISIGASTKGNLALLLLICKYDRELLYSCYQNVFETFSH